jgi:hypothetical protein
VRLAREASALRFAMGHRRITKTELPNIVGNDPLGLTLHFTDGETRTPTRKHENLNLARLPIPPHLQPGKEGFEPPTP